MGKLKYNSTMVYCLHVLAVFWGVTATNQLYLHIHSVSGSKIFL